MSMHLRFFKKFKLRLNVVVEELVMIKAALLSVIIPVYNVEPYLEQCLDSVVNQTYKNLEIICINDGSTDNSLKILEKYQKKDSRIKLINQKNKGLSEARNAGLDVAKGEYIAFVDSDDYLELNAYEEAMNVVLQDKTIDLVEFKINTFAENDGQININRARGISRYYENMFLTKQHAIVVWNKVFKAEIINKTNMRFIPNLIHEDNFFTNAYLLFKEKSFFINSLFYNYRIRTQSIIGEQIKSDYKKKMDLYYNYDALVDFARMHNIYEQKKDYIYSRYIGQISKFCNDEKRLMEAINHWDKKILDSDCSDKLKAKYLKKRKLIKNRMKRVLR